MQNSVGLGRLMHVLFTIWRQNVRIINDEQESTEQTEQGAKRGAEMARDESGGARGEALDLCCA